MQKRWLTCGRVKRPRGLRGEVLVEWDAGSPPVAPPGDLFIEDHGRHRRLCMTSCREQGRAFAVQFADIRTREEAEQLRGAFLLVRVDQLAALGPGEYYAFQIVGLTVKTEDGRPIGKVSAVYPTGGNDVYGVERSRGGGRDEVLIPAVDHVILKIDLKRREMIIREMEGMFE